MEETKNVIERSQTPNNNILRFAFDIFGFHFDFLFSFKPNDEDNG